MGNVRQVRKLVSSEVVMVASSPRSGSKTAVAKLLALARVTFHCDTSFEHAKKTSSQKAKKKAVNDKKHSMKKVMTAKMNTKKREV